MCWTRLVYTAHRQTKTSADGPPLSAHRGRNRRCRPISRSSVAKFVCVEFGPEPPQKTLPKNYRAVLSRPTRTFATATTAGGEVPGPIARSFDPAHPFSFAILRVGILRVVVTYDDLDDDNYDQGEDDDEAHATTTDDAD